uniref:PB1-like domain-containing protein n=1 Tax=Lactuca sativa TaxID=4236 RepID=A0A9R1XUZ8_LACSA|nr:hypothetical protein LSAT_V11C200090120 [Lactuca sativa]
MAKKSEPDGEIRNPIISGRVTGFLSGSGQGVEGYENYFTLKIHYSGVFTKAPGRKYVDGVVAYVDYVDTDLFSVHELDDMV